MIHTRLHHPSDWGLEGRYRLEQESGASGMAMVYLAQDQKHDRKLALKVLRPGLAAIIRADRFLAEIRTTANLQPPHILPLFDSGEADGAPFFVMPYVECESLRDRLDRTELPCMETGPFVKAPESWKVPLHARAGMIMEAPRIPPCRSVRISS